MKIIPIIIVIYLGLLSCKKESINVVAPKITVLDSIKRTFVGNWKMTDFYLQKNALNDTLEKYDYNGETDDQVCAFLRKTQFESKDMVKDYKIKLVNDTLYADKTYFCSTRIDRVILDVQLDNTSYVTVPIPFLLIEKDLKSKVLFVYNTLDFKYNWCGFWVIYEYNEISYSFQFYLYKQ